MAQLDRATVSGTVDCEFESRRGHMQRRFSAGGVVYKEENGKKLWLLIQQKDSDHWQFPKGWIEEKESTEKAALREVKEETGVKGRIIDKIDRVSWWFVQDGEKIFKTVTFFLVEAEEETGHYDQKEIDRIDWLPYSEAWEQLSFKQSKQLLEKAKQIKESRLF